MIRPPKSLPKRHITLPRGFYAAGITCGIKPSGKPDMAIVASDRPCAAAGVFTTNQVPGAPVTVSRSHLKSGHARAIVCNSGVSNVCTGKQGLANAREMCQLTARVLSSDSRFAGKIASRDIAVCSTGVIGPQLPMEKIRRGIDMAAAELATGAKADMAAAKAILTTDLVMKTAARKLKLGNKQAAMGGIAKGSGMIAPNMATMLVFITTDIAITPAMLRKAVKTAADQSFNRLSVDHDTSTSDSMIVLASGAAENKTIDKPGKAYDTFCDSLISLSQDLAYRIIADGEGATKVFHAVVHGARSQADADMIGKTIVGSPLVKTAVHGGDPNWGRLVMAVGRSGAKINPRKLTIKIGNIAVCQAGQPVTMTKTIQRNLEKLMSKNDIVFNIELNTGQAQTEWLGCDLSREYVTINADYTT